MKGKGALTHERKSEKSSHSFSIINSTGDKILIQGLTLHKAKEKHRILPSLYGVSVKEAIERWCIKPSHNMKLKRKINSTTASCVSERGH